MDEGVFGRSSKHDNTLFLLKRYEVLRCGQVEKLIKKRDHVEEPPLYYVPIEERFDIVRSSHIATGHGGRDRMLKEVKKKYANISVQTIELFKSLCTQCQKKRIRPKTTGVVVRPILTKDFACRGVLACTKDGPWQAKIPPKSRVRRASKWGHQGHVVGIKFVQFQKNSSHHAGIKRSPYSALFGKEARVGLTTSSLPREILDNLESEHDLARLDLALASPQLNPPLLPLLWINQPLLPPLRMNPLLLPPLRMNQPLLPPLRLIPPLLLPLRLKLVPLQLTLPLIHLNQLFLLLRQKLTTI
ncbi:hypothetical protein Pmani_008826 [Petrolisthes manimaculis]|uniref:Integrase zinc-binding domain-containing protein n=1 Tax=Petrolisthes manimaculis TaxID=1843537 RepID=A0AAE1Q696_9EUCA|nr:hypothetical protein Pmani_008826 [Petrolisthes manimaculis]